MGDKKTIILIIALATLAIIGLFVFFSYLSEEDVPSLGGENRGFFSFFPGGTGGEGGEGFERQEGGGGEGGEVVIPVLRQISLEPIAGATSFFNEDNEKMHVRFVERETGHVFETTTDSLTLQRITNTTVPRVHEALWLEHGGAVIVRYLDDNESIQSFYGQVTIEDGEVEGSLVGVFLPNDLDSIAVSPDTEKITYIQNLRTRTAVVVSNTDGSEADEVYSFPINEWLLQWNTNDKIGITSRPSGKVFGYHYALNTRTLSLDKIIGGLTGLTAKLSPDGTEVLFARREQDGIVLAAINNETGKRTPLPLGTLPEKCMWSKKRSHTAYCAVPYDGPAGLYPDIWYQGAASFSDNIWEIDTQTGAVKILFDFSDTSVNQTGQLFDVINPFVDQNETFLFFTNKKDLLLWSVALP